MKGLFLEIIKMSITASYVIIAVILMRLLLKKVPKIFSYTLWMVVLLRLICPISLESRLSLLPKHVDTKMYTAIKSREQQPSDMAKEIEGIKGLKDINEVPLINKEAYHAENTLSNNSASTPDTINHMADIRNDLSLTDIAAIIWMLGVAVLFLHAIYIFFRLKNKLSTATIIKDNIYSTDRIETAFVFGLIKPRIYIPCNINGEELEYILMHEQKHISRRDNIVKAVAYGIVILHWFNPLVWVSYFLMVGDMEMSCDESVMRHADEDIRSEYSISMLKLSVKQSGLYPAFGESNVKSRIKNVLNYKKPTFWAISAAVLVMAVSVICLLTDPLTRKNRDDEDKIAGNENNYTRNIGDHVENILKNSYKTTDNALAAADNAVAKAEEVSGEWTSFADDIAKASKKMDIGDIDTGHYNGFHVVSGQGKELKRKDNISKEAKKYSQMEVDTGVGDIEIKPAKGHLINIDANISVKGKDENKSKELLDNIETGLSAEGDKLIFRAYPKNNKETDLWKWKQDNYQSCDLNIDIIITIPENILKYDLNSGVGDILVSNLTGAFDVNTGVGDIVFKAITFTKKASVNTGTGDIYMDICNLKKAEKIETVTGVGDIELHIADNLSYTLETTEFMDKPTKDTYNGGRTLIKVKTGVGSIDMNN